MVKMVEGTFNKCK